MIGLGTLISPKTALDIVHATLEETIKQKMPKFLMVYNHSKQDIGFKVYNYRDETGILHESIRLKWKEGRQFLDAAKELIKEKGLEFGDTIDYAILSYPEMVLVTYYTNKEGEKLNRRKQL